MGLAIFSFLSFGLIGYFLGRFLIGKKIILIILAITSIFAELGLFFRGISYFDAPYYKLNFNDYVMGLIPSFVVVASLVTGTLIGKYIKRVLRY